MKTRPILWSPESVRALLNTSPDGRPIDPAKPCKTQTRRLMKPQPVPYARGWGGGRTSRVWTNNKQVRMEWKAPALAGDHLWGREAFTFDAGFNHLPPRMIHEAEVVHYLADNPPGPVGRYRHARFMPRWCSRLLHQVVSVRPERLQEITSEDAIAEGVLPVAFPKDEYATAWTRLHPANLWSSNPWVWRVEFRRIES